MTDYPVIDQSTVLQRRLYTFLIREHFQDAERSERERKREEVKGVIKGEVAY